MKRKYWAALSKTKNIIAVGFTIEGQRFDRRCFPFSCGTFEIWNIGKGLYCQLHIKNKPIQYIGMNISNVPHGRIRKSKNRFSLFF